MPDIGQGKVSGEALLMTLFTERGSVIGEGLLLAEVSPMQPRLIGEAMLLAIVEQVFAPTTIRLQPVSGDVQWVDQ